MTSSNSIEVCYLKPIRGPYAGEDASLHSAGSINGFGSPARFVRSIALPETMTPGDEFVSKGRPVLILQRTIPAHKEFFSRPFFYVIKNIRLQFHWDSIEVMGSFMESSNRFVFPIPRKIGTYSWYLKVTCKSSAKPGLKPLYISIDTIHENLLLKSLIISTKYLTFLYLVSVLVVGLFFSQTDIAKMLLFRDLLGESKISLPGGASPLLFVMILFLAFWKQISKTLKALYERHDVSLPENLSYQGVKGFSSQYGITVVEPKRSPERHERQTN